MPHAVLASASPRRRELLEQLGWTLDIRPADVDESPQPGEDPRAYVLRLAIEKCRAVRAAPGDLVIAADTTVDIAAADGRRRIAGKPTDVDDARRMLRSLSGRTHRVHTAVAVRRGEGAASTVVTTHVRMSVLSDADVECYVATGEPFDKAGGYAIQGAGGALVQSVRGSVSNVIGLPLAELLRLVGEIDRGRAV